MIRRLVLGLVATLPVAVLVFGGTSFFIGGSRVAADTPGFVFPGGCCFYNGAMVRTVVPPASFPNEGKDNFYAITNGVTAQKGVVAVAPGAVGYNGGHWAVHTVTFTVTPYLLTSEAAVLAAQATGDVTVVRNPAADFLCPIQP